MIFCLISPAKKIDESAQYPEMTHPMFLEQANELISVLRDYSSEDIQKLMSLSSSLADLNFNRYQNFSKDMHRQGVSIPAALAFSGDVYKHLDPKTWDNHDWHQAQRQLGILSGLYGLLRPLDGIQPYRLEMGTSLKNTKGKNLYEFWGDSISKTINEHMKKESLSYVINLASEEYAKVVQFDQLDYPVIKIDFKDFKNGQYKIIGVNAKRARGAMTSLIIKRDVHHIEEIKSFAPRGYTFNQDLSSEFNFIFTQ